MLQVGLDGVEADEELVGNLPGFDALLRQTAHALLRRRQGVRIHFSMMLASVCQPQLFTGLPLAVASAIASPSRPCTASRSPSICFKAARDPSATIRGKRQGRRSPIDSSEATI